MTWTIEESTALCAAAAGETPTSPSQQGLTDDLVRKATSSSGAEGTAQQMQINFGGLYSAPRTRPRALHGLRSTTGKFDRSFLGERQVRQA